MDIIKMTRELCKELQKDERYTNFITTKTDNDNDEDLQNLIQEFEVKRMKLKLEEGKTDRNDEVFEKLNNDLMETYNKIMSNENMIKFSSARDSLDLLLNEMNQIITMSANGADPETCKPSHGCSADGCSSCSGCQ